MKIRKEKKSPLMIPGIRSVIYRGSHFIAIFLHSIHQHLKKKGRKAAKHTISQGYCGNGTMQEDSLLL